MRLLLQVYDEIRNRLGRNVPVMLKMNCDDFVPGGFSIGESPRVAAAICRRGLDALEISGGGLGTPADNEHKHELRALARSSDPDLREASYAGYAQKIREATRPTPMALVNGIRSRRCMESILGKGVADIISMSRPFIREPDIVERLRAGQERASCVSCELCESSEVFSKMMLRCQSKRGNR
jgi:2,4-dienoyl-CoA reductase-like NADH-dependent reductase (Old Yellow Enzyme family)